MSNPIPARPDLLAYKDYIVKRRLLEDDRFEEVRIRPTANSALFVDADGVISAKSSGGDNTLWLRGDGEWVTPAGGGDVVGPASATDNALVRFDSTTGKLVQNSGVTVDDSSNVIVPDGQLFGFGDGTTAVQGNAATKIVNINVDSTLQAQFTTTGLTLNYTTDSTTKDTGGLILQGGLGVEKAVNIGGNLTVAGTGASSVAGTFATGAPTGGAGAWKLGIANAVSPTSPNRTITIDIGGTLYYLHAKTTND